MRKSNIQKLALATLISGSFAFGAASIAQTTTENPDSKRKMDFSELDADQDGMISIDEGAADGFVAKNFELHDGNGDEMLDEAEFAAMDQDSRRKRDTITDNFAELDADDSGTLSKEELVSNEMAMTIMGDDMAVTFAEMDLNNDGQIDDREAMDFDSRRKQEVGS